MWFIESSSIKPSHLSCKGDLTTSPSHQQVPALSSNCATESAPVATPIKQRPMTLDKSKKQPRVARSIVSCQRKYMIMNIRRYFWPQDLFFSSPPHEILFRKPTACAPVPPWHSRRPRTTPILHETHLGSTAPPIPPVFHPFAPPSTTTTCPNGDQRPRPGAASDPAAALRPTRTEARRHRAAPAA